MAISLNALTAAVLTKTVQDLGSAEQFNRENFLINNIFRRNPNVHESDVLKYGVDSMGIFLSGYSRKGATARQVEKSGQGLKTVLFPKIRQKVAMDQAFLNLLSLLVAGYQGPLNADPNAQIAAKINRELAGLMAKVYRQTEQSAAQGLLLGTITLVYEDGGTDTISFGYTGNGTLVGDSYTIQPTLTGTAAWTSAGADPVKNVRAMARQIRANSHWDGPCAILAGYEALDGLAGNTKVHALLDNRRIEVGSLNATQQARYRGTCAGLPVYEYDLTYDTSAGVGAGSCWNSKSIAVIADDAENTTVEYGPAFDFASADAAGVPQNISQQWFSKTVRQEDPPAIELIVESNPLPMIYSPRKVRIQQVIPS